MSDAEGVKHWVREAIQTLGYLRPEATHRIAKLIEENPDKSPRDLATLYRKSGEQVSPDEKKRLGMRASAFMSKQAFGDLTEKGVSTAQAAHEQTILRASLSFARADAVSRDKAAGVTKWECLAPFPDKCPGCRRMDGKTVSAKNADPIGPHDCFREACAISYGAKVQVMKTPKVAAPTPKSAQSRPWWRFW